MLKWILIAVFSLVALGVGYRVFFPERANAAVAEEIRSNPDGVRARESMLITLADGRTYPVNYLMEGDRVFVGVDGFWWRAFRGAGAPVSLFIRGETYRGNARVILDDPAYKAEVFARLRPTVPAWLPDWLDGKLVVITVPPI